MLTLEAEFSPGMRLAEAAELARLLKLAPVRRPGTSMFEGVRETVTAFAEIRPAVKQLS